jgi:hypothetical protein
LLVLLSLLPSVGAATTASKDAIDRVDDIRARLLATDPTPPQQPGEVPGPVSQWYNFPNWPNWNNWNNWVNWGNWGNWLKF